MAWTAPTTRSTGLLVTASIWNTDIVNNLLYLKNAPTFDGVPTFSAGAVFSGTLAVNSNLAVSLANTAATALAVRYNASNPLIGFGIANSNGFAYLGYNTISQTGSDTPKYDINGFASQMRMDNGAFKWLTAASGTAGNAITLTERWGINNAGDLTFGASSHIADSSGTPTIASGGGTGPSIAGQDYAFIVTLGTTPGSANIVINFGHTFSAAPVCLSNLRGSTLNNAGVTTSTTQATLNVPSTDAGGLGWGVTTSVVVMCRGY